MTRIAPSLLSCDFAKMGEELRAIETAGAEFAHLDVMDGIFVPNLTFGAPVIRCLRPLSPILFDVHLMITDPDHLIEDFARAGADYITVHLEACRDVAKTLAAIRGTGAKVGLSIKPGTPPEAVYPYLCDADMILVMTVEPGFGGQKLIPACLDKIAPIKAAAARLGKEILVEVDGGINRETAKDAILAGADILVAGSAVFGSGDYAQAIAALR